jgi:hypothetical protein
MMGEQGGGQDRLFYSFNLDDHVPHFRLRQPFANRGSLQ